MLRFLLLLTLLATAGVHAAPALPKDSIGLERRNGRTFVLHRVEAQETLYAIARRYNATVADVRDANPGETETLSIGQVLRVPLADALPSAATQRAGTHLVAPSQTLFAISRQYNVTVEELRRWNQLSGNELAVGQTLVVSPPGLAAAPAGPAIATNAPDVAAAGTTPRAMAPETPPGGSDNTPLPASYHRVGAGETLYAVAQRYAVSVEALRRWNGLSSDEITPGQMLAVATSEATDPPSSATDAPTPPVADPAFTGEVTTRTVNVTGHDKVIETGLAEVIDNTPETSRYLALHRSAPVGTILQIKNERNGRTVFVRVVGALPDTGSNNKVVVRISQKAYERLEARDRRFLVECSYIP